MSDLPQATGEPYSCWSCGNRSAMRVIGRVSEGGEIAMPNEPSLGTNTFYDVIECPNCKAKSVRTSTWHDYMEHEGELSWRLVYPDEGAHEATKLLRQAQADRRFMELAVKEATKSTSEPGKVAPRVGAVAARGPDLVASAYRGELKPGDHAEFTLLEGKCKDELLAGTTVYTTLEPCNARGPRKQPCLERLVKRKIARVVVGMLDPNEVIRGRGVLGLRDANIQVDLFPVDLMSQLEEMNREFIAFHAAKSSDAPPAPTAESASGS